MHGHTCVCTQVLHSERKIKLYTKHCFMNMCNGPTSEMQPCRHTPCYFIIRCGYIMWDESYHG